MSERPHSVRLPSESDSDPAPGPPPSAPKAEGVPGRPRLLVSACLLGEKVRYDGQHKYDPFLVETLGRFVEWRRVCPESDCGMPTPRPSMHLVGDPSAPRLLSRTGEDMTGPMERFIRRELDRLEPLQLCGYVCKKGSPSSGMARVKVYEEEGGAERAGVGLFTAAFLRRFPLVPVEEEGRLHDPGLRESFIERVFSRRRWLDLVDGGKSRGRLVEFHADHKYLLLAHGRSGYAALGRLVASAKQHRTEELFAAYERGFMEALAQRATAKRVSDVLTHMLGFLKDRIDRDEKAEILETVEAYRRLQVPLIVPLTLLKHHVRKHRIPYLSRQVFLSPYPAELMLRNHV